MANHKSSKKRIRRNDKRAAINGARMSRIRTFIKKVELALVAGDAKEAESALQNAQPEISRGVVKGILHKNTAARKVSRLSSRIKLLKKAA
ncbi:MAG TPA: 30S ribosomal protein S20 [Alphaproteobacteria bacterium]|nr:30S ribosomal protein S20 [Alphaproteobacteria bacterium]USO05475.1 MAG: 30S ribosomal protein S20 [Rhodospirillales bacterium]HOO81613.1 30S ribosomal protein S20 [Alphaproteobacteria bacterium]